MPRGPNRHGTHVRDTRGIPRRDVLVEISSLIEPETGGYLDTSVSAARTPQTHIHSISVTLDVSQLEMSWSNFDAD